MLLICRNTVIFYIYFSFPKFSNYPTNANNLWFRASVYTVLLNGRHWRSCFLAFQAWSDYATNFARSPACRGCCLQLPEGNFHFPRPCNQEQPAPPSCRSSLLSRDQQPGTSYRPCPLPPSPRKHAQVTNQHIAIKGITTCTE